MYFPWKTYFKARIQVLVKIHYRKIVICLMLRTFIEIEKSEANLYAMKN